MQDDDPTLSPTDLEVVSLANGRFSVLPAGSPSSPDDEGEFDTREEAEAWLFQRAQELDAQGRDAGIMLPGSGQGLR